MLYHASFLGLFSHISRLRATAHISTTKTPHKGKHRNVSKFMLTKPSKFSSCIAEKNLEIFLASVLSELFLNIAITRNISRSENAFITEKCSAGHSRQF